jgi:AcrR family transcriptional regulator
MERRVFAAALAVYAEAGWSGFSFDVVARAAGVGKHAMYLRWSTREELLVAALDASIVAVPDLDRGSVREDLLHLLTSMLQSLSGPSGLAPLRVLLEAHAAPELFARFAHVAAARVEAARAAIQRGIDRGELPPDTDVVVLADSLSGAVINRVLVSPFDRDATPDLDPHDFAVRVIEQVLPNQPVRRARASARTPAPRGRP